MNRLSFLRKPEFLILNLKLDAPPSCEDMNERLNSPIPNQPYFQKKHNEQRRNDVH